MFNKIKLLANTFLIFGVVFGIISLLKIFQPIIISQFNFLNFSWHAIVYLLLGVIFIVLGISLKCIYKELSDEIQAIYNYYDKKIKDIEEDK